MWNKLPIFLIQNSIEPYTRSPQNSIICDDIKHFGPSLKLMHSLYCYKILDRIPLPTYYPENLLMIARVSWKFIEMDLLSHILHYDLVDELTERGLMMTQITYSHIIQDVTLDVIKKHKSAKARVYRLWGFLTIEERKHFLVLHPYA